MDELLTPVSTTYRRDAQQDKQAPTSEIKQEQPITITSDIASLKTIDEALDTLRGQPDYDSLLACLRFLVGDPSNLAPGPKSAAVIQLLVTEIAPNYWALLSTGSTTTIDSSGQENDGDAGLFIQSLRSLTGINAVLAHLRSLIQEGRTGSEQVKRPDISLHLGIFVSLLGAILDGPQAMRDIWTASTAGLASVSMIKAQSHSLASVITNGRVTSLAAEALFLAKERMASSERYWIAEGLEYSKWLARTVAEWTKQRPSSNQLQFLSELFQRAISLGHHETLIQIIAEELILNLSVDTALFADVCLAQPQTTRKVVRMLLAYLSSAYLGRLDLYSETADQVISSVAGVIHRVVGADEFRRQQLITWCTSPTEAGLGDSVAIRRAVVAVLAQYKDPITAVLEKSLSQFGDELYIKHAAMLQQEAHAQILLLSAGYVARLSPIKLAMLIRSGTYLKAISNRIASTQPKARFLGMVVGESLSSLTDKKAGRLDFHMEEMETDDATWLKGLTTISDDVGSIDRLVQAVTPQKRSSAAAPKPKGAKRQHTKSVKHTPVPKAVIEEVNSSEDDDDLVPYMKGSDPEDSDEDPTLVQRNKTKPPVYIRDLIAFFRDSENYDKQKLALQTAPSLIRRKAHYGTELSQHADELASLLAGAQDKFEIDQFDELKLQGMIALVVSQPKTMGPWFSRTFFEGDFSLSQRTSILVTLGLSARELAGFEASSYQSAAAFPSKRLPEKMEQLYIDSSTGASSEAKSRLQPLPSSALTTVTDSLTSSFLAPIAANAADATTGPDVLKLQTFTSRYKSKTKSKPRVRAIPNTTASLLADSFFSPLTAHFQVALRSSKPIVLNPALLALYLQTLGVIIHAAGPSTLSLPQLTSELWSLLLAVRVHVMEDLMALRGWLVAMAAILEVHDADMRTLCVSQAREVMETREWVSGVFERTRGEDGGVENEAKMLAAGILIKLGEAIEKHQALLMGDIVGFS